MQVKTCRAQFLPHYAVQSTTKKLLLYISETHIVLLTLLHLHSSTSAFTYRPTLKTGNPVARIVMYISANRDM